MEGKRSMPAHTTGVQGGENLSAQEGGSGRYTTDAKGAGRPGGKSTPADFTGINPNDRKPIDPSSPVLIAP